MCIVALSGWTARLAGGWLERHTRLVEAGGGRQLENRRERTTRNLGLDRRRGARSLGSVYLEIWAGEIWAGEMNLGVSSPQIRGPIQGVSIC